MKATRAPAVAATVTVVCVTLKAEVGARARGTRVYESGLSLHRALCSLLAPSCESENVQMISAAFLLGVRTRGVRRLRFLWQERAGCLAPAECRRLMWTSFVS